MLTKNPLSDLPIAVPAVGDKTIGLQKQADGSYKNVLFAYSGSYGQVIAKELGADFNSISDQILNLAAGNKFSVLEIIITNPSVDIDTAKDAQFWTGPNRTGYLIGYSSVSDGVDFGLSKLSIPDVYINSGLLFLSLNGQDAPQLIQDKIYFSLGTPQGVAATADIYIIGMPLS